MRKNVASQVIGAQMVSASNGAAFTSAVTAYVTGDGGTQAVGSVASGACAHEGNGFHTYAPAQAETNYDHIGFTFIGTGAVPATVQVYPSFPQTGDNFARLGAPAGASVSADVAAAKADTAAIKTKTDFLPSATAGAAGGVFIAGTNAATVVTTSLTTTFTGNLSGSVASVTGAVGSVTGLTAATVHSDLDDIQSRLPAALIGGRMDSVEGVVTTGTAQAGAVASITLAAGASATDGIYDPSIVRITSGTGLGQARMVIQYVGSTKVASVDRDWRITPDNTSVYEIIASQNLISTNEGLAQGGAASTITLNASASAVNDTYNGQTIVVRTGTGQDQSRIVSAYNGTTKVATVSQAWTTNPAAGTGYIMWPLGRVRVVAMDASVITAASIAADAITDAKVASDVTIASVTGAVGSVTGAVGSVTGAVGSVTGNVGGNVTGSVGSVVGAVGSVTGLTAATVHADLDDIQARLPAALVSGRMDSSTGAMAANVLTAAAIADAAIDRATFAADTGMQSIRSNTAQAGAATTITLDASASAVTDFYKNDLVVLTGGTGVGQGRYITAYNGTTKVATVSAWATNPDNTTTFAIIAADAIVGATAPTAVQVADEVQTRTIAAVTTLNGLAANVITAASIADAAFDRATFAADTGMQSIRSNTAQAGAATTITLDASASAVTDFYKNDLIVLTGGTGVGQGRYISAYNGTTKVATVSTWATNPGATTTFAIMAADAIAGATAPTAVQVADEVQTRTIAAVTTVNGLAANVLTAASAAADLSAEISAAVWAETTRVLTAGTNIVLAKGVGVTGFNDLSAAQVNTEADTALADVGLTTTITGRIDAAVSTRASQTSVDTVDDFLDTEVAAIKAKTDNLPTDPADASVLAGLISAVETKVDAVQVDVDVIREYADNTVIRGTCAAGGTTTTMTPSAISPAGVAADQFKGRILVFDNDTTTTALRGQATDITANTAAGLPLFTFTALTNAPASSDTFSIV